MLQSGGNAGVDEPIAVLKLQTAEDSWVDENVQVNLLAEALGKLLRDSITVLRAELDRGGDRGAHAAGGDGILRASMNGRVVAVLAKVGDTVEAGAPLVTLEAMKMEHVHGAPRAGMPGMWDLTSGSLRGSIALVSRGGCPYSVKSARVRDAGASKAC